MLGDSLRRRRGSRRSESPGRRPLWQQLLLWLPVALAVPFVIGYFMAVRVLFPPTAETGPGIAVPELVGRTAEDAQRALAAAGLGPLETVDMPHPSAPAGLVIAQSPLAGQQLRAGAPVQVALSGGRARVMVPDVTGFSADRAESLLRRSGFDVERVMQESAAATGRVIRSDPEPGQERVLPATITLIVSLGPPAALPDTMVVDTLATSGSLRW